MLADKGKKALAIYDNERSNNFTTLSCSDLRSSDRLSHSSSHFLYNSAGLFISVNVLKLYIYISTLCFLHSIPILKLEMCPLDTKPPVIQLCHKVKNFRTDQQGQI